MNIVVLVKQVFDTEAKIVLSGSSQINAEGVTMVMNPYDENAVEEALLLKEKNGGEVVIVSMGAQKATDTVRTALAMGADRAILVSDPALAEADQYTAAQVLAKAIGTLNYDLILSGRMAIDDQASQVPARVAEILGLPHINVVTKLEVQDGKAVATREIDGGVEVIEAALPAIVTAQKSLNKPRYPSVPNIMKAKKKELKTFTLADLGLNAEEVAAKMSVMEYALPPGRQAGRLIPGEPAQAAAELASLLRNEAKAI